MIRKRLIFALIAQLVVVLLISGIYLRYRLQNVLEKELGNKLESLAGAVAAQMDASLISLLMPGDDETRMVRSLRQRLANIADVSGLRRIMIFSSVGTIWLDSDNKAPIGSSYVRDEFDRAEIQIALTGRSTSSILFQGQDGGLYKSGYAPLKQDRNIIGVVVVEGSAQSLRTIIEMQKSLLQIGFLAGLLSIGFALFISWQVTRPILRLQQAAKRIGQGELGHEIPVKGHDEVAFLAKTMDEMRRDILQRGEQQKAMLAGVAHEIRNPLGGIELFAGLLRDELQGTESQIKADRILKETKNLKSLVENFIDYARPIISKPELCRIKDAVSDCQELLQVEMSKCNIHFEFCGDARINVDPQHIKQILLNLMLNGVQAMNQGGELKISVEQVDRQVYIDVTDQGHGIVSEEIEKIFTPFYSRKERGLGLGLTMVKALAEANGGSANLLTTGSSGTQFRLIFPATT